MSGRKPNEGHWEIEFSEQIVFKSEFGVQLRHEQGPEQYFKREFRFRIDGKVVGNKLHCVVVTDKHVLGDLDILRKRIFNGN